MNLAAGKGFTVPLKMGAFIVALGQGADDPNAGNVVPDGAHHAVYVLLHGSVQLQAPAGDQRNAQRQQGQRGQQHQTEPEVHQHGDDDAAGEQNGRAHAQTLHPPQRLVDVVGVAGQAGDQAGYGQFVHLPGGQVLDFFKQIVADAPGRVPGHGGGPAVGDNVARQRDDRAQGHARAPEENSPLVAGRDDLVNDVGQDPRNGQIHHRARQLDAKARQHPSQQRLQISEDPFHASHPTSRSM